MAIKRSYSILARKKKIFVPLPKEQRLTDETLIALERRIARSSRKNEVMLEESYKLAEKSSLPGPVTL
ncbi:MAG: hypothetical protein IKI57_05235 [Clostridia bacterium]|nr:hypothetical protein [Clostridia bacterium]